MSDISRCYDCMAETGGAPVCPACGWQAGNEEDNPLYLPAGYLLRERYLIGNVLGVGGFGIVYLAWDSNLDVRVAVKEFLPKEYAARGADRQSVIPYSGSAGEEFNIGIGKFLEEAKALAKFQDHPGIVRVYESFRANNTAFMVMQYLDGMTMKEYLKNQPEGRIPYTTAVMALNPIMDALREVHAAGFVHRDISPDNVFITRQKQIKLLDFGAARYAIGEHSKSLTSVLKHGYAPVEQYSTKGNQGPWSDVYAVSATIYRCITGIVPPDAMERMQGDTIRSPKQLNVEISLICEAALMKGLALKAGQRYPDIQQLQKALLPPGMTAPRQASPVEQTDRINPPQAPVEVTCPECGTINRQQPGTEPRALRCTSCKRELRSRFTAAATGNRNGNSAAAAVAGNRPDVLPTTRDYGSDEKNYRLIALKIVVGLFVVFAVAGYFFKQEPPTPAKPAAGTITAPVQTAVPEGKAAATAPQKMIDTQPLAATNIGVDWESWKYLLTDNEKELYYNPSTQKQLPDGTVEVVIDTKQISVNRQELHLLRINCQQQKYQIFAWDEYKDDVLVKSGRSDEPLVNTFQPNTMIYAAYQTVCH